MTTITNPRIFTTGFERNRIALTDVLHAHGLNGYGVEIGVKQGNFSKQLLQNWNCIKLYLVDPWMSQSDSIYDETHHDHESDYSKCLSNVRPFTNKFEIVQAYSHEAYEFFKDEFFDFIYIDANHSNEAVKSDIELWYPKLKPGGLIAGDDYTMRPEETVFDYKFGVKRAVDEFAQNHKKNVSIDMNGDWYYPSKHISNDNDNATFVYPSRNWYFFK